MGYQLSPHFHPPEGFVFSTIKGFSFDFDYADKSISNIKGLVHLTNLLGQNIDKELVPEKLLLVLFEPGVKKVEKSILRFFARKKRKLTRMYQVCFVINVKNLGLVFEHFYKVDLLLDRHSRSVAISAIDITTSGIANDKLLTIAEITELDNPKILYAACYPNDQSITLWNGEFDTFQNLIKGYSSDEISVILKISKHTVDDCRKVLLEKFKAINNYQLIKHAQQEGFI